MRRAPPTYRQRLRGVLHRGVLAQIADTVLVDQPDGSKARAPVAAWKEHFRGRLLAEGKSTEDLSDPEYLRFIVETEAIAATEMGVEFRNREGMDA